MGRAIDRLTVKGFKSIRSLEDLELRNLNILIGANGAGKSNFVSLFTMIRALAKQELQLEVKKHGGADALLFLGPKITKGIEISLHSGLNGYMLTLEPTRANEFVFAEEKVTFRGDQGPKTVSFGGGHSEAKLTDRKSQQGQRGPHGIPFHVYEAVSGWVVYHFHDTSENAAVRRMGTTRDYEALRPDAGNLAAFLLHMRDNQSESYQLIRDTIRLVTPFFDEFLLRPEKMAKDRGVQLEWRQRGSDYPFHPSHLSDGTLRFICMATALLQPDPPATILFDEPELGLHPYALSVLAGLLKQAAVRTQVIVSTQSAPLLDHFLPEDIIVVDRDEGASNFRRLSSQELSEWVSEYSLGELWQKNVFSGSPVHE